MDHQNKDGSSADDAGTSGDKDKKDSVRVIKTPTDLQRLKLEKLMKNPSKPAYIPDVSKEKLPRAPLEFIRNIWGSSAGAGSGDFHVYRGVRRREYARQKYMNEKHAKEDADAEFRAKVEKNAKEAEDRTAKKRAKRLKKKEKLKAKKKMKKNDNDKPTAADESSSEDESD